MKYRLLVKEKRKQDGYIYRMRNTVLTKRRRKTKRKRSISKFAELSSCIKFRDNVINKQ